MSRYGEPKPPAPLPVRLVRDAIIAALRESDPGAIVEEAHGKMVINGHFDIELAARRALAASPASDTHAEWAAAIQRDAAS